MRSSHREVLPLLLLMLKLFIEISWVEIMSIIFNDIESCLLGPGSDLRYFVKDRSARVY